MQKNVCILGSTGSIGRQTLEVCRLLNFPVKVLAAHSSCALLFEQIKSFRPELAVLADEEKASELKSLCRDLPFPVRVEGGEEAVSRAAAYPSADIVVAAMVGMAGLKPVLSGIEAGKDIALANKETLVAGGNLVMGAAKEKKVRLLPVDSEHSAIWQCLACGREEELDTLYLTCSGGPFRGRSKEELREVTREEALQHPTWKMGGKISIDSATLMNKGLELIEACHLFSVNEDQVEIVVHPESIIHSMVGFRDHSVIAQLGFPDMRLPIQLALTYPRRLESLERKFDPFSPAASALHFYEADTESFPAINLARTAQREGKNLPIILNAANEVCVGAFLDDKLKFLQITEITARTMEKLSGLAEDYTKSLEAILYLDKKAREQAGEFCRLCSN